MTRREKILKAVQKIWNKCDHTFHRLGGVDDCPDCKIIKALCEENEKLRSALEKILGDKEYSLSREPHKVIADKALAESPLDTILEGEK